MPDLPTFTVTSPQATRMLAAWGSVENYKLWLRRAIIQHVIDYEVSVIVNEYMTAMAAMDVRRDTLIRDVVSQLEDPADPFGIPKKPGGV